VMGIVAKSNWEKLRLSGSMKGHIADQKQVLIFQQTDDGPAALSKFTAKGELAQIHKDLLSDGLAFHTLVPTSGGATVFVADLDGSAVDAIKKASGRYGSEVEVQFGRAEFLGTTKSDGSDREQRDDARKIYEGNIKESSVQGSQEVWARVRDRWGQAEVGYSPGVKASGLAAADELKAEWATASPITSLDHLMAIGSETQNELVAIADAISEKIDVPFQNPGVKSRARAEEKLGKGRTPQMIRDVVRGGFKVDKPGQADAIVKELGKSFEVADEGWQTTPAGYCDRKVMVRFSNGVVGEIQIWQPVLLHAKEEGGGHALYVQWGRAKVGSVEAKRVEGEMQRIYAAARAQLPPEWDAILGKAGS
jgi:hypothetical protein